MSVAANHGRRLAAAAELLHAQDLRAVIDQVSSRTGGRPVVVLEVDDPATPVVDLRIPLTVLQAASTTSNTAKLSGSVQRNLSTSLFVPVPAGTKKGGLDVIGVTRRSGRRGVCLRGRLRRPADRDDARFGSARR